MGLIHDLRGVAAPKKQKNTEEIGYNPLFLKYVKQRSCFHISADSLDMERTHCLKQSKKTFEKWMRDNRLKIVESNIKDHFKIYY